MTYIHAADASSSSEFMAVRHRQRRGGLVTLSRRVSRARAGVRARVSSNEVTSSVNDVKEVEARVFGAGDSRPVVLFDGVCNMCNGGVNFVINWDRDARLRVAALQSDTGRALLQRCGRAPDDISSIVLVEAEAPRHWIKSDAILRIGTLLDMPLPLVCSALLLSPNLIRDGVYDVVADNRYNVFGKTDSCRLPDGDFADRFV